MDYLGLILIGKASEMDKNIAVIGVGKLGGTLCSALMAQGVVSAERLVGTTAHQESARNAASQHGIRVLTDNAAAVAGADLVILAVKPQGMGRLLQDIKPLVSAGQLVLTLAAAITTHFVEDRLQEGVPVVRAMPNLPSLIGQGMTVLCAGRRARAEHLHLAKEVFLALGRVAEIDSEELMDAATGLSGSGPAYGYIIVEALAEGGVKVGLPRSLATTMAAQSILGAASMVLETGQHPALLKDMVTTPAGTTVNGLMALEEGNIRVSLIKAVEAATLKAKELSR